MVDMNKETLKARFLTWWQGANKPLVISAAIIIVIAIGALASGGGDPPRPPPAPAPVPAEPAPPPQAESPIAATSTSPPPRALAPAGTTPPPAVPIGPPLLPAIAEPGSLRPGYRIRVFATPSQQQPVLLLDALRDADLLSLAALPDPAPVGLGGGAWRTEIEGFFRTEAEGLHTVALRAQGPSGYFRGAALYIGGRDAVPAVQLEQLGFMASTGDASGQIALSRGLHRFRLVIAGTYAAPMQVEAYLLPLGGSAPALIAPLIAAE
jgi:hypothetical protein